MASPPPAVPHPPKEGGKILDIERLRGIAILLVLFEHLDLSSFLFQRAGVAFFRKPFWLGVELFFLISGYVVTRSFLHNGMHFRAFYVRRVFRLWPVLLTFFALVCVINQFESHYKAPWSEVRVQAVSVLFGYYDVWVRPHLMYFGVLWSLAVEEQFYLAAPLVLFLCHRFSRNPSRTVQWVLAAYCLVIGVGVRFAECFGPRWGFNPLVIPHWILYQEWKKFDFLALGVLLYFRMNGPNALSHLGPRLQRALILAALVAPFVLAFFLRTDANVLLDPALLSFGMDAAALCFFLVVGLASQDRDLLHFGGLIDRVVLYFGSRSYGLYVFHFTLYVVPWLLLSRNAGWLFAHQMFYGVTHAELAALVVLPFVEVVYRCVEVPSIRQGGRLSRWLQGGRPRPAAAAVPARQAA